MNKTAVLRKDHNQVTAQIATSKTTTSGEPQSSLPEGGSCAHLSPTPHLTKSLQESRHASAGTVEGARSNTALGFTPQPSSEARSGAIV